MHNFSYVRIESQALLENESVIPFHSSHRRRYHLVLIIVYKVLNVAVDLLQNLSFK